MPNSSIFVYPEIYSEFLLLLIAFVGAFFMLTEQKRKARAPLRRARTKPAKRRFIS